MLVVFSRKQMLQFDRMHSTDLWLFLVIIFKIDRTDYQFERNNRKLNNLTQCRQQIIGSNLVPGCLFVTSPGSSHSLTPTSPQKSNLSRIFGSTRAYHIGRQSFGRRNRDLIGLCLRPQHSHIFLQFKMVARRRREKGFHEPLNSVSSIDLLPKWKKKDKRK